MLVVASTCCVILVGCACWWIKRIQNNFKAATQQLITLNMSAPPRQSQQEAAFVAASACWVADDYALPPKAFKWYACVNRFGLSNMVAGRIAPMQRPDLREQGATGPFGGFDDFLDAHCFLQHHGVHVSAIKVAKVDKFNFNVVYV